MKKQLKIYMPFALNELKRQMAYFAKYPTEIYARFIRFIITWIIPFAFVAYLPASYFLGVRGTFGLNGGVGIIGIECIIAAVFWVVAYAVFNRETKKLLFH